MFSAEKKTLENIPLCSLLMQLCQGLVSLEMLVLEKCTQQLLGKFTVLKGDFPEAKRDQERVRSMYNNCTRLSSGHRIRSQELLLFACSLVPCGLSFYYSMLFEVWQVAVAAIFVSPLSDLNFYQSKGMPNQAYSNQRLDIHSILKFIDSQDQF